MITISEWKNLSVAQQKTILRRPIVAHNETVFQQTQAIITAVKNAGDIALREFTVRYDKSELTSIAVSAAEIANAESKLSAAEKAAILFAKEALTKNHLAQLPTTKKIATHDGVYCERAVRAIEKVGLYVPGGKAPLVSSVLMLAVPAQIANCSLRILCTPPNEACEIDPRILFAASICGIKQIYKVGGAQAIAAMAYGTESVPQVDKIFGPGNQWVMMAKSIVAQDLTAAAIDMPAGPSELLVIADDRARADFVAADLLSQAEHGVDSQVVLVTLSNQFAQLVRAEVSKQVAYLSRADIIMQALKHARFIVAEDRKQAIDISNCYAPEHLILQIANPTDLLPEIKHAGAVFVGEWTPETLGDYVTGSNHVLPTSGQARNFSGLAVTDFMKFLNIQTASLNALRNIGKHAEQLAMMEGLDAHKNAVSLRLKKENII